MILPKTIFGESFQASLCSFLVRRTGDLDDVKNGKERDKLRQVIHLTQSVCYTFQTANGTRDNLPCSRKIQELQFSETQVKVL